MPNVSATVPGQGRVAIQLVLDQRGERVGGAGDPTKPDLPTSGDAGIGMNADRVWVGRAAVDVGFYACHTHAVLLNLTTKWDGRLSRGEQCVQLLCERASL